MAAGNDNSRAPSSHLLHLPCASPQLLPLTFLTTLGSTSPGQNKTYVNNTAQLSPTTTSHPPAPLASLEKHHSQNPIFATFHITWFPATAHTSSKHQILVAQDNQPCGPLGFYSITRLLCALASITPNFCATTEIQSTMSSSQTNAWLRAQRKLDLVQVADSVGLKKYAVFLSCTSSFFFLAGRD